MRFLRVFGLGAINARLFGESFLPVELNDHFANLTDGFLRKIERVGTHIGNEPDRALAGVDALVELLRDAHGLLSRS